MTDAVSGYGRLVLGGRRTMSSCVEGDSGAACGGNELPVPTGAFVGNGTGVVWSQ